MSNLQEGVAVMRQAQQNLATLVQCIDYLSQSNAHSALRSIAIRCQVLAFRAGQASEMPFAGKISREE